ncbi:Copper transport protein ATX1 [Linum perenne]
MSQVSIPSPCLLVSILLRFVLHSQTVVLRVAMSCEGCSGAVKRVLTKMEGVESFDIDMKEQKVTVKGNVKPDAVLQTVSKTGKKTSFWEGEASGAETVA